MNSQAETGNSQLETPTSSPQPCHSSPPHRGRPRALDDTKRREICALISGGCDLREAARYVDCSVKTIRRELRRDSAFREQIRRSQMHAQLSPLRAMQQAVGTHWRAAAWMLERAYPKRFGRRDQGAASAQQARRLLAETLEVIHSEVIDPFQSERIEKRLRATFEYTIQTTCDSNRSARGLRRAISFFDTKDRLNDPLARFGFPKPDFASIFNPQRHDKAAHNNTSATRPAEADHLSGSSSGAV